MKVIRQPHFHALVSLLSLLFTVADKPDAVSSLFLASRSSTLPESSQTRPVGADPVSSHLLCDATSADPSLPTSFVAETALPTSFGLFRLRAYRVDNVDTISNPYVGTEPCVIYGAGPRISISGRDVPVRVHDQCVTSEVFGSQRCDCREQLRMALEFVACEGGIVIYLQQEGRGIGIANKVAAYALQDKGFDTVDANLHLGLPEDCRQYGVVPSILEDLGIKSVQLLTNNPRKIERLRSLGVEISSTRPVVVPKSNPHNRRYLETKATRMDHMNMGRMLAEESSEVR